MKNKASGKPQHRQSGFTLVEVMVALMIVAVAISSLLFQMMSTINNTAYLREQTIAHWVALNQLELVYLENRNSNQLLSSERSGTEEMAGKEWFWRIKPVKTDNADFAQLVVSVYADEDDQESSIVSVTGLIDRFHRPL
ncbi:type II secretion system minor pseudopilin GspI [Oceanicoccus sagamiensis]|uniref:Type II secretion system protein I n=1 Tax=Oceanicoccus sagamiensis TaxID=716816 RepID=A0A1X9NEI0_9GAMM|nr:type II secretion system minor pseudopilin GspI [Oceanicoccus sagamiensis]ARN74842.1 type II secretion system protein GspI [Oceanicoccus sagamiensis]